MTINLTEEQVAYLQEFVSEKLEYDSIDLEEAEMLHDLADKLNSDYYDDGGDEDGDEGPLFEEGELEDLMKDAFSNTIEKDPNQIDLFETDVEPISKLFPEKEIDEAFPDVDGEIELMDP